MVLKDLEMKHLKKKLFRKHEKVSDSIAIKIQSTYLQWRWTLWDKAYMVKPGAKWFYTHKFGLSLVTVKHLKQHYVRSFGFENNTYFNCSIKFTGFLDYRKTMISHWQLRDKYYVQIKIKHVYIAHS